jgi:type IV pilus biogenesis protein CpaD/CtpE
MALPSNETGAQEMQERVDMLTSIAQRKASMNEQFAQIIRKEVRKAFRQQSHKRKKHCTHEYKSVSKSDDSL